MKRSLCLLGLAGVAVVGCNTPVQVGGANPSTSATGASATTTGTGGATSASSSSSGAGGDSQGVAHKVDLLLMIDNSRSMADKQQLLKASVPYLTNGLVNPRCVDGNGTPSATQPAGPLEACPAGSSRVYAPVLDLHVGVITSSLGGHGADICNMAPTEDDHGELISRTSAMASNGSIPTYQSEGFLAWDPAQEMSPPGIANVPDFESSVQNLVVGADQLGCGYESQLESWYRFLVDPQPYQTISVDNLGDATPSGTDATLLTERASFMRPDSLLIIVMLSDENDCSIKEYGPFWQVATTNMQLPAARSECATDPNDPCCLSCAQDQGSCPAEPDVCGTPGNPKLLPADQDNNNLRCWENKRRFGIDFLNPIDRYTQALTSTTIADKAGNVVENPIFAGGRAQGLAMLTSIVGVPWQDIANDPTDVTKGFQTADQLTQNGVWDRIVGDVAGNVKPSDPLMVESVAKRTGTNPATGATLKDCPDNSNPINGCEWDITGNDDLQYACIFRLEAARDCGTNNDSCDCGTGATGLPPDSPVCQGTTQVAAKAYPGLRELAVTKSIGAQGVVGSICAVQSLDASQADFAYLPSVSLLLQSASGHLVK